MPPVITLTFRNDYRLHCTTACYQPNANNKGCICGGRNTGIGLDTALDSNREFQLDIAREAFRRFPHAMYVMILIANRPHPPKITRFDNPHPIIPRLEPPPPPA